MLLQVASQKLLKESKIDIPIVVRLEGTNVDLAKTCWQKQGHK